MSDATQPAPPADRWRHADGTELTIRSIRAADLKLESDFVRHLSPQTGYQRFMSARHPSEEELRRFTDIDPGREIALIVTLVDHGVERQVGVARCIDLPVDEAGPGTAEFAIVIADAWQGRGLGLRLMQRLIEAARAHGLRRLVGTTLSDNTGMLQLARHLGFVLTREPGLASVTDLTLDLLPR